MKRISDGLLYLHFTCLIDSAGVRWASLEGLLEVVLPQCFMAMTRPLIRIVTTTKGSHNIFCRLLKNSTRVHPYEAYMIRPKDLNAHDPVLLNAIFNVHSQSPKHYCNETSRRQRKEE